MKKRILSMMLKSTTTKKAVDANEPVLLRSCIDTESVNDEVIQMESQLVLKSGLFDEEYYLTKNKDVKKAGIDPLMHYVKYGAYEGRQPSRKFDAAYYLERNPDVREMRVNPLLHYWLFGKDQGRKALRPKRSGRGGAENRIDIINVNFYDWDGKILFKGGAERYVYDLACIIQELGLSVRILQNANHPFKKTYHGIEVIGVKTGSTTIRGMSKAFAKEVNDAKFVIASPLDLACELNDSNVIGINHGIHWDTIKNALSNLRMTEFSEIFDALQNIEYGVCVDTNFINWVRTCDYSLAMKLVYVPNYYNPKDFVAKQKDFSKDIVFTYPRRLYDARGIYLTLDVFDEILKKHSNIKLNLVGQTTDDKVIKAVNALIKKYPGSVTLKEYDMEDMYTAYEESHVVMIPTRYAEGTSLSCIEGMATNNALIATNVGGLPNLVINRFNGMLIEPNTESLKSAVEELIEDRNALEVMAKNGKKLVGVFDKKYWDQSWQKILKEAK